MKKPPQNIFELRPKPTRAPKRPRQRTVVLRLRMDEADLDELEAMACEEGIPLDELVAELLRLNL